MRKGFGIPTKSVGQVIQEIASPAARNDALEKGWGYSDAAAGIGIVADRPARRAGVKRSYG